MGRKSRAVRHNLRNVRHLARPPTSYKASSNAPKGDGTRSPTPKICSPRNSTHRQSSKTQTESKSHSGIETQTRRNTMTRITTQAMIHRSGKPRTIRKQRRQKTCPRKKRKRRTANKVRRRPKADAQHSPQRATQLQHAAQADPEIKHDATRNITRREGVKHREKSTQTDTRT
jgi:hypothetical protein